MKSKKTIHFSEQTNAQKETDELKMNQFNQMLSNVNEKILSRQNKKTKTIAKQKRKYLKKKSTHFHLKNLKDEKLKENEYQNVKINFNLDNNEHNDDSIFNEEMTEEEKEKLLFYKEKRKKMMEEEEQNKNKVTEPKIVKKKGKYHKLGNLKKITDEYDLVSKNFTTEDEMIYYNYFFNKTEFKFKSEREKLKFIQDEKLQNEIKEMQLINKIKYKMTMEHSEKGKELYKDLLDQIQNLKDSDLNSYLLSLANSQEPFKEELKSVQDGKEIEDRINKYIENFIIERELIKNKRNILKNEMLFKDYKFKTTIV